MTIVIDTVGACLAHDYYILVRCRCGRDDEPDLAAIAAKFGEDVTLEQLRRRLKCRHCKHPPGVTYLGIRSGAARRGKGLCD
ncbi:hypothetical protein [Inquilinus sp. CA228]|uniref:hypothetical protein n=1 Tax=Inquilinus sp. CA228 TaxID=3455609 RepID=UPI003F8D4D83